MKIWKRDLLIGLVLITVLSLLLSACGPVNGSDNDSNHGKGKDKDQGKGNDPNNKDKNKDAHGNKIAICHRTGSEKNPYVLIRVANDAIRDGHAEHAGDLIPAPEGRCPETAIATDVPVQ